MSNETNDYNDQDLDEYREIDPIDYDVNYSEPCEIEIKQNNKIGNASVVVSSLGALTAFFGCIIVLCPVGLILGIIGLTKKGKEKGTAWAGIIVAVVALIIYSLVFISNTYINYNEKAEGKNDRQICYSVSIALTTLSQDQSVITASDYTAPQSGRLIYVVKDAGDTYENEFQSIMGDSPEALERMTKSPNDGIYVEVIDENRFKVYLANSPNDVCFDPRDQSN